MRSLWLILFVWLTALPAMADSRFVHTDFGFTEALMNRETGELQLYPGASEQIIFDETIDQYAPGSQMRTDYAAMVSRFRNEGVVTGYFNNCTTDIDCRTEVKISKIILPEGKDFFDHHFEGLRELRTRLDAAAPGPTTAFHQDILNLMAFYDTHEQIARIVMILRIPTKEEEYPDYLPTLHALFENRYFPDQVQPQPKVVLSRNAIWNIDLGLFALPFDRPERPEHKSARRVTYDITSIGETEPQRIRLKLRSDLKLSAVGGTLACDEHMDCETAWSGPMNLIIEFSEPVIPEGQFDLAVEINTELSIQTEAGEWELAEQNIWPIDFSKCDSRYVKAIRALKGSDADPGQAALQSRQDLSPVAALPGHLLYGEFPMENADDDEPAPPPAKSHYSTDEMKAALQSLARRKLLDDYLSKDVWGADGEKSFVDALEELPFVLECDADRLEALYSPLEKALPYLREGRETNELMAEQAQASAAWWSAYVKLKLEEVRTEQKFETSDDPVDKQLLDFGAATELGLLIDMLVELKYGAEAMATTSSRVNAVGAILVTAQALSSVHDLYKLYLVIDYGNEAASWLEAAAYFAPMAQRYQQLEERVEGVLNKTRMAEAESCRCFNP